MLLTSAGKTIATLPIPKGATGLSAEGDRVAVVGEYGGEVRTYRALGDTLLAVDTQKLPGAVALRDVSIAGDRIYAIDEHNGTLYDGQRAQSLCRGPVALERSESWLAAQCIIDHSVVIWPIGGALAEGWRIVHDGPIWSVALAEHDDGTLTVALGGVENHKLDRSRGFFGHVDSFVYGYRIDGPVPRPIGELNIAEHGVVTPKAIAFLKGQRQKDHLIVTGYGADRVAFVDDFKTVRAEPLPPGSNDIAIAGDNVLIANPLLDAWMTLDGSMQPVGGPRPREHQREIHLGEVLFFTTLMAPYNNTDGAHSRFTCETCHYEGYVDGRVHFTGRGTVHATTKPLLGLFNNKPHFTRALDRDLTQVSHAEFRVAGQGSGHDPWFSLSAADRPWLRAFDKSDGKPHQPVELRRALLRFLMAFNHRPHPLVYGRTAFSEQERDGARLFRDTCAGCHAARLITDDAASEVAFDRWEALVLDRGPIVWASSEHQKTGVEPYVHEKGARTTSLRRLYKKQPYFTNGSAKTLDDVIARVRFAETRFFHDDAPSTARSLGKKEQAALLAFLRLL